LATATGREAVDEIRRQGLHFLAQTRKGNATAENNNWQNGSGFPPILGKDLRVSVAALRETALSVAFSPLGVPDHTAIQRQKNLFFDLAILQEPILLTDKFQRCSLFFEKILDNSFGYR
jgi:hypothetical protein